MRSVLNAKFCVLFVELIIVSCIFFTKYENIAVSSSLTTTTTAMASYIDGFAGTTVGMIGAQMLLSIMGVPLRRSLVPYQLNLQVVGLFGFGCFILMRMQYQTIAFVWGVFGLLPFLVDIAAVILQLLNDQKYSRLDSS